MQTKLNELTGTCIFSGESPDSDEHVVPKWLQGRFGLWNQAIVLPNQTAFRYAQAKVPAQGVHNGRFSAIENSMANGTFTLGEAYLWALKIHIGMMYLDSRLKRERKEPNSTTILRAEDFSTQTTVFRKLYKNWANGGATIPDPFGSVFVLAGALTPGEFDFFHCMISGALGISIDHRFLVVLLWDHAEAMRGCALRDWEITSRVAKEAAPQAQRKMVTYMARHVWACEVAHELWRRRRPFRFHQQGNIATATPSEQSREPSAFDRKMHIKICRSFALKPIVTDPEEQYQYQLEIPSLPKSAQQ